MDRFRDIVKEKIAFITSDIAEDFETCLSQLCNRTLLSTKASTRALKDVRQQVLKGVEEGLGFFHSDRKEAGGFVSESPRFQRRLTSEVETATPPRKRGVGM